MTSVLSPGPVTKLSGKELPSVTMLKYTDMTTCLNVLKILGTGLDKCVIKIKKLAGIQSISFYAYDQ